MAPLIGQEQGFPSPWLPLVWESSSSWSWGPHRKGYSRAGVLEAAPASGLEGRPRAGPPGGLRVVASFLAPGGEASWLHSLWLED